MKIIYTWLSKDVINTMHNEEISKHTKCSEALDPPQSSSIIILLAVWLAGHPENNTILYRFGQNAGKQSSKNWQNTQPRSHFCQLQMSALIKRSVKVVSIIFRAEAKDRQGPIIYMQVSSCCNSLLMHHGHRLIRQPPKPMIYTTRQNTQHETRM